MFRQPTAEPATRTTSAADGTPPAVAPTGTVPLPVPRGRRNPKWIALGVVLICLGALASYVLYASAAESHQVVAVRQTVARGEVLEEADLTTVTVGATPGIATVDAGQLSGLIGRRTAVDLVAGSLLPPGAIADEPLPAPRHSIVGVRLADGRAPRQHLEPGAQIRLVAVPATDSQAASKDDSATELSVSGRVVDVTALADGQSTLVDVDLDSTQSAAVAKLAAADRLVVIRDADG